MDNNAQPNNQKEESTSPTFLQKRRDQPQISTPVIPDITEYANSLFYHNISNLASPEPNTTPTLPPTTENIEKNNTSNPSDVRKQQITSIETNPLVYFSDGTVEIQDVGTTLGDLLRYYPNYYLIEDHLSSKPIPHRSSSYVLQNGKTYLFTKDHRAVDFLQEFSVINEKIESLAEENLQLKTHILEILSISNQVRKDQLVKQNIANACFACFSNLRYKIIKVCKLCDEEFCAECTTKVSFPAGFHLVKEPPFIKPKICCCLCLSSLFYLRNHPPPDQITTFIEVKKEKFKSKGNPYLHAGYTINTKQVEPNLLTHDKKTHRSPLTSTSLYNRLKRKIIHTESDFDHYHSSYFFDGSFYTAGDTKISIPLKFLDPLCRLTFWFSGMQEGDKFDRKKIDRATGTKYSAANEANRIFHVDVPLEWPDLLSSELSACGHAAQVKNFAVYQMKVLVFLPSKMVKESGKWGAVLFFHGGGFCVGRPTDQIYENACAQMAEESSSVVISVDYRLAPEFRFPTQVEDGYAALNWVYDHADMLNIDKDKIIVCGDSAGGTIAAVVAIMSRDRKGPPITHQILIYPCVTYPLDDTLLSHRKYENGPILTRKILEWFLIQLFGEEKKGELLEEMNHIYASPLKSSLFNLPPATIINANHDPLRDQGLQYAKKLQSSNVTVNRTVYRKSTHGFFGAPGGESAEALKEICAAIRVAFDLDVIDTSAMDQFYRKKILE